MKSIHIQPAAVIFDMDGLMIDTEIIYRSAWQSAASALGYHIEDSVFDELIGVRTEECEQTICAHFGQGFPLSEFQSRWIRRWEEIAADAGIELKPGLLALLDRLDALGILKAVGTSSTASEAERCLRLAGLRDRFSIVVTGDQVPNGKPAPDIFLEAARRLVVTPAACVVFEDSNAGAEAAYIAGMPVYVIPDLTPPTPATVQNAADIFESLHDALALFGA